MKLSGLIGLVALALVPGVSCSRAETPTEPSSTGLLRVTTVLEGQCPPSLDPGPIPVYVDGSQVGKVPLPGASSFVLSVGSHTVGMAPGPSGIPVYIQPDLEHTLQWAFGCSGFSSPPRVLAAQ